MRSLTLSMCAVALTCAAPPLRAQSCAPLSQGTQANVSHYLAQKYRLPQGATLTLKANTLLAGTCMRELTFGADWPTITITVLLSPDGRYAFPGVFDLSQPAAVGPAITVAAVPRAGAPAAATPLSRSDFQSLEKRSGPSIGPTAAPVTIVEFSDFECPFCKRLAQTLRSDVLPANATRVRVIYREFPLPMHPWAETAAEMAECVAVQNESAFWQLHDFFFANQAALNATNLAAKVDAFLGEQPSISLHTFHSCVSTHRMRVAVDSDIAAGKSVGVRGTPTFFVNGVPLTGARSAQELDALIARQTSSGVH